MTAHRRRPFRTGASALVVLLLAVAAGCGNDGGGGGAASDDSTSNDGGVDGDADEGSEDHEEAGQDSSSGDSSLPPDLEDALLSSADVEGWEVQPIEDWSVASGGCPDDPGVVDAAVGGGGIELTSDGGFSGVFQDVVQFSDEAAATAFVTAYNDSFDECLRDTEPPDPVPDQFTPLDLEASDLGANAHGWRVTFRPHQMDELIDSMEAVIFQRGDVVVTMTAFLPLASELDLIDLATTVYGRL